MKNLIRRIEQLEAILKPTGLPYTKFYNTLREMEASIPGPPEQTPEEWKAGFIQRHGTFEEFLNRIKNRKKEV